MASRSNSIKSEQIKHHNNDKYENHYNESDGKSFYHFIPARYLFVFMGFLSCNLVYAYKVVLSVSIVAIVGHQTNNNNSNSTNVTGECVASNSNGDSGSDKPGEFAWTQNQQSMLLGAFFYGYVITQIPAGFLSERYGAKWIYGVSLFFTGLLALLTPFAARFHWLVFFGVRFLQGLLQGVMFPCMNAMFARWLPKMERGLMSTITFTGAQIGTVITLSTGGILSDGTFLGGWPAIFYILGVAGCIWFVMWTVLFHETPQQHPNITRKELQFIKDDQGDEAAKLKPKVPWAKMFTSIPLYAVFITHFANNWGFAIILTLLPTYFEKILHLNIKNNGLMSSLPYLLQAIFACIVGYFGDKLRQNGRVRVNIIRKVANSVAFFGPAFCLIGVVQAGCNSNLSVAFFALAMGLNGAVYSGFSVTPVDMAPAFAGTITGISNSFANINGFIQPMIVNILTNNHQTLARWSIVFYMSAGVYALGGIIFIIFGNANLQPWGSAGASVTSTQSNVNNNTSSQSEKNSKKESDYQIYKSPHVESSYCNNIQID